MNVILFGSPGVGKGTQAKILGRRLGVPHISTGELFRAATEAGTELGQKAREFMDAGRLVPDEVTTAMALERLAQGDCNDGFVLDGYPRNINQAKTLDEALESRGCSVDHVIYLVAPPDELVTRMLNRGRGDDTEEVILTRLGVYEEETAPVLHYFRSQGLVTEVNGVGEIEEVNDRILTVLGVADGKEI